MMRNTQHGFVKNKSCQASQISFPGRVTGLVHKAESNRCVIFRCCKKFHLPLLQADVVMKSQNLLKIMIRD